MGSTVALSHVFGSEPASWAPLWRFDAFGLELRVCWYVLQAAMILTFGAQNNAPTLSNLAFTASNAYTLSKNSLLTNPQTMQCPLGHIWAAISTPGASMAQLPFSSLAAKSQNV